MATSKGYTCVTLSNPIVSNPDRVVPRHTANPTDRMGFVQDARDFMGLAEGLDESHVMQAFKREALLHHPDRTTGSTAAFQRLLAGKVLLLAQGDDERLQAIQSYEAAAASHHVRELAISKFCPSAIVRDVSRPCSVATKASEGGTTKTRGHEEWLGKFFAIARACLSVSHPTIHEPFASAQDCRPAGLGSFAPKRKASGDMRRAKKAAREALEEDGGYVNLARGKFRETYGNLVTGTKRTCVADAIAHLMLGLGYAVQPEEVRTIMPTDPEQNTKFEAASQYVATFDLRLDRVTKEFQNKGGIPYHLLLYTTGSFVVQLRVTTGKHDPNPPDFHCVAFDGTYIKDNYKYSKVKKIEDSDRTKENARLVFDSFFPGLEVRVKNVYRLARA